MIKKQIIFLAFTVSATQWAIAAETNLGSIGQTQLQQDTGDAVQRTCIGFIESGALPGTIPLFDTCSAMVLTANELLGLGSSDSSLGLSTDQLAAALQQIATEEYAATESIANEIAANRMDSVISRLHSLRGGTRGFAISGIGHLGTESLIADKYWNRANESRGAGAGDELLDNALSGFATINFGTGDRDSTDSSDAFDFSNSRLTLGVDYRLDSNLVIGGAVNYSRIDTDFDKRSTVTGGNVDTDGWGGVLYGTYYRDQYYVDGLIGYAVSDYDIKREISIPSNTGAPAISNTAKASPESSDYTLSVGGGYALGQGPVSFGPYFRASYMRVDIDGYQEQGAETSGLNLSVTDQEWTSFTSVLGVEYAYTISQQQSIIIPQVRLGWVHQFENDSSEITATYVNDPRNNRLSVLTDDPDRNYFELTLGISSVIQDGIQLFANYDTLLGLDNLSDHQLTLGGRWEY
ncbi:MAG: autotransporter outer membrane beta-barrel domain-containing protein [Candidatus Thiodiazotropha sp. (ex Lucinoma annulata)]|nr:autotransporter outer membrane beta-barrel domain-containing protein [Candidatus Thiodiazotropha sp. (ex Lucinoma borealis)]MCU7886417.1 autotransporter outer membrane beta-barrel domain-containing protein [Candidatus Thiodiazotropha sp. (ex Lucinoma annulata)]